MASGVFIAALALLVATSIAYSLRERPLAHLLHRIGPLFGIQVSDTQVFLSILLVFDLVCVALLARFGIALS